MLATSEALWQRPQAVGLCSARFQRLQRRNLSRWGGSLLKTGGVDCFRLQQKQNGLSSYNWKYKFASDKPWRRRVVFSAAQGDGGKGGTKNVGEWMKKKIEEGREREEPVGESLMRMIATATAAPIAQYIDSPFTAMHSLDPRVEQAWLLALLVLPPRFHIYIRFGILVLLAVGTVCSLPRRIWQDQPDRMLWLSGCLFVLRELGSPTSTKRAKRQELLLCSAARLANQDVSSPVSVAEKFNKDMAWVDDSLSKPKEPIQYDDCEPPTSIYAPDRRIVAIGDVHGDLERTESALRLAGVLSSDGQGRWVGGSTVLVQVGDILDRGEDELAILSLLHNLGQQALLRGGAVFQVNGNHETMNVGGDYRYVEAGGFEECSSFLSYCEEKHSGDWKAAFEGWYRTSKERKANKTRPKFVSWLFNPLLQKGAASRALLFSPGGPIAMQLARHGVVLKLNDWLFAHGGILPHHVNYGLERINKEVTQWMRAKPEKKGQLPFIATRGFDSIVWSRLYSQDQYERPEDKVKAGAVLEAALDAANAKGLIVGHTPQPFGANCEFKGRVWRIDVGMSSGVLHAEPEVLEIVGDKVQVLSASPYGEKAGALGVADAL